MVIYHVVANQYNVQLKSIKNRYSFTTRNRKQNHRVYVSFPSFHLQQGPAHGVKPKKYTRRLSTSDNNFVAEKKKKNIKLHSIVYKYKI